MKRIESAEQFVDWAKRVNLAGFKDLPDLQDEFARSETAQLRRWFVELKETTIRELLVFSIQKAMGSSLLLDFVRRYAREWAEERIQEDEERIAAQYSEVARKNQVLDTEKSLYEQTIKDLRNELALEHRRLERSREENILQRETIEGLEEMVKDLEREMVANVEELNSLRTFETRIKNLIEGSILKHFKD